jgi:rod shape determining protein RodA
MKRAESNLKIFKSGTLNKGGGNSASHTFFYFKNLKAIHKVALLLFVMLVFMGIFNLATISPFHAIKQIVYFTVFIPIGILIISINPRYFLKYAYVGFVINIIFLLAIFLIGDISGGARRWINLGFFKFQPSEFSKIITIIAIARYYHFVRENEIYKLKYAIIPLILVGMQVALILKQPDLGTSITIVLIGFSLIFLAGLRIRYFVFAFFIVALLVPILWNKLHDYQKQRVMTFLNPEEDKLGTGYNIIQAKIAIGSGGFLGKGPFGSTQGTLEFLPESHTDFAFTVFAEQFGFLGCMILLLLYSALILYGFSISMKAESHFIRLVASGISCLFFFHIIINLSMTSGLIPVVGNPLPFLSYGGTFLISGLSCFAILLNLDVNKFLVIHSSKDTYMEK